MCKSLRIIIKSQRNRNNQLSYACTYTETRGFLRRIRKWPGNERRERIPPYALARGALPIVRDNYRINKFTSWRNAYNISTSAKWYRDTVVYHRGSYSPRPVTHCRAYVVSRYPFGSYPPRCSMARIVRHARSMPLKNRACLSGNIVGDCAARTCARRTGPFARIFSERFSRQVIEESVKYIISQSI